MVCEHHLFLSKSCVSLRISVSGFSGPFDGMVVFYGIRFPSLVTHRSEASKKWLVRRSSEAARKPWFADSYTPFPLALAPCRQGQRKHSTNWPCPRFRRVRENL